MPTHPEQPSPGQTAFDPILALLTTLLPESVGVVEPFVQFLPAQAQQGQPVVRVVDHQTHVPLRYPTIDVLV